MLDVHAHDLRQLEVTIRTPENLELTYTLAGAGSRSAAFFIDSLIVAAVGQLLVGFVVGLVSAAVRNGSEQWGAAIGGLLLFGLTNSYFLLFEWLMNGQTPGKRVIGIRVIKQGGYALRLLDVVLRNLMRAIDFLPVMYGVGLASLILTPRCQRLGDLAAGTLVVHSQPISTDDLLPRIPEPTDNAPPFGAGELAGVPSKAVDLAIEFFAQRERLAPRYRSQIAVELCDLIVRSSRLSLNPGRSAESFLAAVIQQSGRIPTSASGWDSPAPLPFSPGV